MIFEPKTAPLAPRIVFLGRMLKSFSITLVIIGGSLLLGTAGYHWFGNLGWLDALLNASMILTGMGPVSPMATVPGKLFSVFYALFSGIVFLTLVAVLAAPVFHRFLHKFHLDEDE